MIERNFGSASRFSLGVEEEIMILDDETLEPVGAVDLFLRESEGLDLPGRLKTEFHASIVELNTGICADAVVENSEKRATTAVLVVVFMRRIRRHVCYRTVASR